MESNSSDSAIITQEGILWRYSHSFRGSIVIWRGHREAEAQLCETELESKEISREATGESAVSVAVQILGVLEMPESDGTRLSPEGKLHVLSTAELEKWN